MSTNVDITLLGVLILLILCSAFFSMSETAFSSVSSTKLKARVENRESGAKKALALSEDFEKTLTTLLVGNNIVNTALGVLSVGFFAGFIKSEQYLELIATIVITITLLIFGEILPKTIGKKMPEVVVLKVSFVIYSLQMILYPIILCFNKLQKVFINQESKQNIDEDELEAILDTMEEEGSIESNEVEIIKNVFDLNDRNVSDIMVPRVSIIAFEVNTPIEEIKEKLLEHRYSRIPVYDQDKDNIIGILYEREFLSELVKDKEFALKDIIRPVKFVSKAMKVADLIHELQRCKTHIAVVSGEYGDTVGIVTMEDALEELVGEIYDEHDVILADVNNIVELEENKYVVDGEIYVDYLFEELEIGNAPEDTSSKLATWLFDEFSELPSVGDSVSITSEFTQYDEEEEEYEDYCKEITFEIKELDGRRIKNVIVTVKDKEENEEN